MKIPAAEAYGERDEGKVAKLEIRMLPGSENLQIGQRLQLASAQGVPMPCVVSDKDDEHVTLDMNHPLAGRDLTFEIELIEAV